MAKKKVLIVERDQGLVDLLTMVLAEAGYEVECLAESWQLAEGVERRWPQLLILGLRPPPENACHVLDVLFASISDKGIPVLAIISKGSIPSTVMDRYPLRACEFICGG